MLYAIFIAVSAILGIIAYVATINTIVGICVATVSLVYFLIIFNNRIKSYSFKINRYHECYKFINTFIISLSVTNSLIAAFERTTLRISPSLQKELNGITNLEELDKIDYLKKYFPFHVYELFLNVIHLFLEQGGDILAMSSYLTKEARLIEEYIDAIYSASLKRVVELIFLWVIAFVILIFIRFGLSEFFKILATSKFYPISIGIFFVFVLISIDVSVKRLFDIEIRGFKGYEKNKKTHKRIKS